MFCRKCGKQILDDSNFCSFCGTATCTEKSITHLEHTLYITEGEATKGVHKEISFDGYLGTIKIAIPEGVKTDTVFYIKKLKLQEKETSKMIKKTAYIKVVIK